MADVALGEVIVEAMEDSDHDWQVMATEGEGVLTLVVPSLHCLHQEAPYPAKII